MNAMVSIEKLDCVSKDKFLHPANRLIQACRRVTDYYHANPIARDFIPEFEATAAWMVVTCSYSGIEQSIKCILQMRGSYIDEERRKGGHRHHFIGELFEYLSSQEKEVIRTYYSVYRLLHDYIPPQTADCFLSAIDDGYPKWRYFLLEDSKPPTTHCGAMVEVWTALSDILCARVFTNHGLQTVDWRIAHQLRELFRQGILIEANSGGNGETQVNELNRWARNHGNLTAAFATLLRYRATKTLDALAVKGSALRLLQTTAELAERDNSNQDFSRFVQRARTGDLPSDFYKNRVSA